MFPLEAITPSQLAQAPWLFRHQIQSRMLRALHGSYDLNSGRTITVEHFFGLATLDLCDLTRVLRGTRWCRRSLWIFFSPSDHDYSRTFRRLHVIGVHQLRRDKVIR